MPDQNDPEDAKTQKAHDERVDTSNGALFLRILDLERQVKHLEEQIERFEWGARALIAPRPGMRIGPF